MWKSRRIAAPFITVAIAGAVAAGIAAATPGTPTPHALAGVEQTGAPAAIELVHAGPKTLLVRYGPAVTGRRVPLRPDTPVRIGSITKTFVAVVTLQLAAEHRLSLDDTLERWLPGALPYGRSVTVRNLLQQTSGIPDHLSSANAGALLAPLVEDPRHHYTPAALVASVAGLPQEFPAGTSWGYSNTNYVLLGMIVEKLAGKPLTAVLAERVFRPARLRHSSFPRSAGMPRGAAHGYLVAGNPVAPTPGGKPYDATHVDPSYTWAAGAIVSTAADVDRFVRALVGGELVPRSALTEMERTRPIQPGVGYGLGLLRIETPCGPLYGHNGMVFGYSSIALASASGRSSVVAFATTSHVTETSPDAAVQALTASAITALCPRAS